jgi:hypothetical protein
VLVRKQSQMRLRKRVGAQRRLEWNDGSHAPEGSINCAVTDYQDSQRFFGAAKERHFKIDASDHFNLKWSLALQTEKLGPVLESRIGTINAVASQLRNCNARDRDREKAGHPA